jgi:hypothetical protein
MHVFIEILAIYVVYAVGTAIVIRTHGGKERIPSIVVAWVAPFIAVAAGFSFVKAMYVHFTNSEENPVPCPIGLEEAEHDVELHRHALYGGKFREPQFARSWAKVYERALERQAERVRDCALRFMEATT